MYKRLGFALTALTFAAPANAVEVVFNDFPSGTMITDQYGDFSVKLEGTTDSASLLSRQLPSGEFIFANLINSPDESSTGFPLLLDFFAPVSDLMLTFTSVNGPGSLKFTTESAFESVLLDYSENECRIVDCTYDLSSFGPISDLRMAFNNRFENGSVNFEGDAFGLISISYSLTDPDSGGGPTDPGPGVVPLPATSLLLLGALGAVGIARHRRRS